MLIWGYVCDVGFGGIGHWLVMGLGVGALVSTGFGRCGVLVLGVGRVCDGQSWVWGCVRCVG